MKLLNYHRGQMNIFSVLFVTIIFLSIMALGFGKMINAMIGIGVSYGNVTGIEAFLLNNFVLIIFFIFILWFMIATSNN